MNEGYSFHQFADAGDWPASFERKACSKVLPLAAGLADANPALEIAIDAAEMFDQLGLLGLNPRDDPMKADGVALALG